MSVEKKYLFEINTLPPAKKRPEEGLFKERGFALNRMRLIAFLFDYGHLFVARLGDQVAEEAAGAEDDAAFFEEGGGEGVFGGDAFAAGYHAEVAEVAHLDDVAGLELLFEDVDEAVDDQFDFAFRGGAIAGDEFAQFFKTGFGLGADLGVK